MQPQPVTTIREIKHNLDGRSLEFECQLLHREADWLVLYYVSPRPYGFGSVHLPAGCRTTALYQRDEPYVFWRIESPSGSLMGYYVHLACQVSFDAQSVNWDDLTLDVWVHPDGRCEVWDEEELQGLLERGIIGPDKWREVQEIKQRVLSDLAGIVASAGARLVRATCASGGTDEQP